MRRRKDRSGCLFYFAVMSTANASITVRELLERYPRVMSVFIEHRMLCVGCPTKAFHTLADVARMHGCDLERLMASIEAAVTPRRR